MELIDTYPLQALVGALGWTLVHFLWQGCVVGFGYWLVCAFSKEQSAHLRYWSGLAAYVVTAGCLFFTFKSYYRPAAEFAAEPLAAEPSNAFLVLSGAWPDLGRLLHGGIEPVLPLVVVLWAVGVCWLTLKAGCEWIGALRWVRQGAAPVDSALEDIVQRLAQQLEISQQVRLLQSTVARVPMVFGILRPVILLPVSTMTGLPRDQLEMVLAHELGHIKRADYLFNLIQLALETLLFFHPAMRWMGQRIRHERELCCDDLVVTTTGRRVVYAKALANVAALSRPTPRLAIAASGGNLVQRVGRIVNRELSRDPSVHARMLLPAVVALVIALSSQPGVVVQRALEGLALSVQVQASDVEYELRNRSREAWLQGISRLPQLLPEAGPPALVVAEKRIASVTLETLPDPPAPVAVTISPQFRALPQIVLESLPPEPVVAFIPVRTVEPQYPWTARRDGIEGFVELEFSLDSKGKARDIAVVDAMPRRVFDRSAIKALKRWRFDTERLPAPGERVTRTFDFQLDSAPIMGSRFCSVTGSRTCSMARPSTLVVYVNPPKAQMID